MPISAYPYLPKDVVVFGGIYRPGLAALPTTVVVIRATGGGSLNQQRQTANDGNQKLKGAALAGVVKHIKCEFCVVGAASCRDKVLNENEHLIAAGM